MHLVYIVPWYPQVKNSNEKASYYSQNQCTGEKDSWPPSPFHKCLNVVPTLLLEAQGQSGRQTASWYICCIASKTSFKKKKVKTIMGGCFCCRLLSDCCCALKFVYCASFCCRELTCTRMQGSCPASDDRFGRKPGREVICKSFRPLYAYVASYLLPL